MNQILHSPGDDHLLTARALRVMKNYGGEDKKNGFEKREKVSLSLIQLLNPYNLSLPCKSLQNLYMHTYMHSLKTK